MKTILVLTDFSKAAGRATEFALELAQKSSANLLLYHSFIEPECDPTAATVLWRKEEFHAVKERSEDKLKELALRIAKKANARDDVVFKPAIRCMNGYGSLAVNVRKLLNTYRIYTVIMGCKNSGNPVCRSESKVSKITAEAGCPVLAVSEEGEPGNARKVIYAANPRYQDKELMQLLRSSHNPDPADLQLLPDAAEL